jgi:uncharacterized protein (DUF427 family)
MSTPIPPRGDTPIRPDAESAIRPEAETAGRPDAETAGRPGAETATESVWDYPRPPALRACPADIEVRFADTVICRTSSSWQVLETSHPPTYYLPRADFAAGVLREAAGTSFCEWKGSARYLDVVVGDRAAERVAWYYPNPTAAYAVLRDHLALYAGPMDQVLVGGETVVPQPGGFYGGWITSSVTGPFKGVPGSHGW